MANPVVDLEVLFTANTAEVAAAEKYVRAAANKIESNPATQTIKADDKQAIAGMKRVEDAAKKLVSKQVAFNLDADITRAEKGLARTQQKIEELQVKALGGLDVTADTKRAEAALQKTQRQLDALQKARTMIEIDADSAPAEAAFRRVRSAAADAGAKGGADAGSNLADGIIGALVTIPIVGAVVGIGQAAGQALFDAFQDGLEQEKSFDRLQALTGITEADAVRLGRTSSEAYANGFGDSIESNMDLTRLGVQFDIIDPAASTRDSKKVIEGLAGIADVLEEDVQPVARTTASLLTTGLAKSSQEAFDIFAAGAREGVNRGEDLLDTLNEYSSTFASIGLTGGQTLGLLNQGLKAGAPNTDFFADSLRELGIRLRDGDEATAGFVEKVGLVPASLQEAFSKGGPEAGAALDELFDKLNQIEDPIERNKVAVGLLGTQFEDLQFDVSKIDLSTAEAQMNGVEGAAQKMFDTLASNDASKIQVAQRNVEVAMDGIKGALAAGFSEPLAEAADWVSSNRGPILQFFSDLVDGAIDFGHTLIDAAADGTEAFGEFVSGPLAEIIEGVGGVIDVFNGNEGRPKELDDLAESMRGFKDESSLAAENIRGLHGGLDEVSENVHGVLDGATAMGFLNDASLRAAEAVSTVGYAADGSTISLDGMDLANLSATESGAALEEQVRNAVVAMGEEQAAAAATGESQDALTERHNAATEALVQQLVQMGLSEEQARALIDSYNDIPPTKATEISSNAAEEQRMVQGLADRIVTLPDGSTYIRADTEDAQRKIDNFVTALRNIPGRRDVVINQVVQTTGADRGAVGAAYNARGNILEFMAAGGVRGLTPMQSIAQMVPASTWRVVGDRSDVPEAYIPLDGSPRSMAILAETMQRMGVQAMSGGGVTTTAGPAVDRERPIMMDGRVFGVLREQANGDAQIIVGDAIRKFDDDLSRRFSRAASLSSMSGRW